MAGYRFKFCSSCGKQIDASFAFCPHCGRLVGQTVSGGGSPVPQPVQTPSVRNNPEDFLINGTILRRYTGSDPVVYIPEGVTETGEFKPGEGPFYGNKKLQKVVLPSTMKKIGNAAFSGCSGLSEIVLPNGLKEIGIGAFDNCGHLSRLVLPDGIKKIERASFNRCSSLTKIVLPDGIKKIEAYAFFGCISLTEIVFPGGITEIGEMAFRDCKSLTKIVLPEGLKVIGGSAFSECESLQSVVLPDSLESIKSRAFEECYSLSEIRIPSGVTELEVNRTAYGTISPFVKCTGLINVVHPQRFSSQAFAGSPYALTLEEQEKQERLAHHRCPVCGAKLNLFGNKCPKGHSQF